MYGLMPPDPRGVVDNVRAVMRVVGVIYHGRGMRIVIIVGVGDINVTAMPVWRAEEKPHAYADMATP